MVYGRLLSKGEGSPRLWRWLALRDSGLGQAASLPERRRRRLLGQASVKRGCGVASYRNTFKIIETIDIGGKLGRYC